MMEDLGLGLKRTSTTTFTIMEKVLMVMVEVYIGLRTDPIRNITQ